MMDKSQILLAKNEIANPPMDARDVFLKLASFNLLNSAVKKPEFGALIKYANFKPLVSCFIEDMLSSPNLRDSAEYISIDSTENCVYIKCQSLQFSFHGVKNSPALLRYKFSPNNRNVEWEGIRLQKIAEQIFNLALLWKKNDIDDKSFIENVKLLKENKPINIECANHSNLCPSHYYATVYFNEDELLRISDIIRFHAAEGRVNLLRNFGEESIKSDFRFKDRLVFGIMLKKASTGRGH